MKIAITGIIGSGKSTVSQIFRDKGYKVYDADAISRELSRKGNAAYKKIVNAFDDILDAEGEIDRRKLAAIVFTDSERKKELEDILHPLIVEDMLEAMEKEDPFIAEVPLLYECNLQKYFDETILVVADHDILVERLMLRGLEHEDIMNRINNQFSVNRKMQQADTIITNNNDLSDLEEKVGEYIREKLQ